MSFLDDVQKILDGNPEEPKGGHEITKRVVDMDLLSSLWGTETKTTSNLKPLDDLSRLIFLVASHKIRISRKILRYLTPLQWDQLYKGIGAVDNVELIGQYYQSGSTGGVGSISEAINIILRMAMNSSLFTREPQEWMAFFAAVDDLNQGGSDLEFVEVDLNSPLDDIEKFNTGFTPFDTVLGGFYTSLVGILAEPGVGKTSLCITLAEECLRAGMSVWFFENEIPPKVMGSRFSSLTRRNKKEDIARLRLFCGPYNAAKIVEMVKADPDEERVVFFDSPDVVFSGDSDARRFDLEDAYRLLISIKSRCKFIVVTTQGNRSNSKLSLKSVAEAWAKSWYVDIMLALSSRGNGALEVSSLKNRFGLANQIVYFPYNYANMTWTFNPATNGQEDWEKEW